eukprot:1158780-Pelagomonas_calceolata.AAC.8
MEPHFLRNRGIEGVGGLFGRGGDSTSRGEVDARRALDRKAKTSMLIPVEELYKDVVEEAVAARDASVALEQQHKGEAQARECATAMAWASIAAKGGQGAQQQEERVGEDVQSLKRAAEEYKASEVAQWKRVGAISC